VIEDLFALFQTFAAVDVLSAVETRGACGFDDGLEIPVIGVADYLGEVPAGPEFIARRAGAADLLKGRDFVVHVVNFGPAGIRYQRMRASKDRRWR
jgi:hypothetical protein